MKKLLSKIAAILTAACMLPAIPAIAASSSDTTVKEWSLNYEGTAAEEGYMEHSDEVGLGDSTSMIVSGSYRWYDGTPTKMALHSAHFDMPAGTYTFSFSAKNYVDGQNNGCGDMHIWFGNFHAIGSVGTGDNMDSSTDDADGWVTYTKTVSSGNDVYDTFVNLTFMSAPNMYIDNVSIKDANGREYVPNGDFSQFTKEEIEPVIETKAAEWKIGREFLDAHPTSYIGVDKNVGYDGNASMHIYGDWASNGSTGYDRKLTLESYKFIADPSKTYTFTAYTKGDQGTGDTHVYYMPTNGNNQMLNVLGAGTNEDAGDGWVKRSFDFTPNHNMGYIRFNVLNTSDYYLDGVSIVEKGTNINLVSNGSFEEWEEGTVTSKNTDKVSNNWTVSKEGTGQNNIKEGAVSELSFENAHTGNASWLLSYPEVQDDTYYGVRTSISAPAGNYTMTLYTSGIYSYESLRINADWKSNGFFAEDAGTDLSKFDVVGIEESNGWKKWTINMVFNDTANYVIIDIAAPRMGSGMVEWVYIDDISLKDANGREYITDGGFENYTDLSVEYKPAEWKTSLEFLDAHPASYAKVDKTVGYDGNASMHIHGDWVSNGSTGYDRKIAVESYKFIVDPSKTYTFTAYTKGDQGTGDTHVYYMPSNGNNQMINVLSAGTNEDVDNGWVKRSFDFTPNHDMGYIRFNVLNTSDYYLDGISLVEKGTNINLISNGSFEEWEEGAVTSQNTDKVSHNWTVSKEGTGQNNIKEGAVSELSFENAHTGNASWLLSYPEVQDDTYYGVRTSISAPAGNYTMTLYTSGIYSYESLRINADWKSNGFFAEDAGTDLSKFDVVGIEESNGWKKWTINMVFNDTANYVIIDIAAPRMGSGMVEWVYIDDISLKDANGREYIANGGFENYTTINRTDLDRVMAYAASAYGGTAGTITWVNPSNDNISSITMKVNGEAREITPNTSANAFNEVELTGLTVGTVYDIELTLTIGDTVKTYNTQLIPHAANYTLGAWTAERHDGAGRPDAANPGYANATAELDKTVGYNSNSSLKIVSNRDGYRDHTTFRLTQRVAVEQDNEYVFSYKVKAENLRDESYSLYFEAENASNSTGAVVAAQNKTDAGNGWYTYTHNLIASSDNMNLQLMVRDWIGVAYIDDVELKLLDPDYAVPTGDNLLADGGFEFAGYTVSNPEIEYYVDIEGAEGWANVTAIEETGKYRAIAEIRNISEQAPLDVSLFLAVYKNGRLVEVVPASVTVPQNVWVPTTITSGLNVSDITGCTIKAIMWEGAGYSLTPIKDVETDTISAPAVN